jgi:predicted nuclease of predicted toxin-antitoxin system
MMKNAKKCALKLVLILIFLSLLSCTYSNDANSIIYATAISHNCVIWTQDADFENFKQVKFFPKDGMGQKGH